MNYKDIAYEVIEVTNIRDYNKLLEYLKENNLPVLQVKTFQNSEDKEVIKVHTEGDKNHIEFVKFLLKKSQKKAQKLLNKIKVK